MNIIQRTLLLTTLSCGLFSCINSAFAISSSFIQPDNNTKEAGTWLIASRLYEMHNVNPYHTVYQTFNMKTDAKTCNLKYYHYTANASITDTGYTRDASAGYRNMTGFCRFKYTDVEAATPNTLAPTATVVPVTVSARHIAQGHLYTVEHTGVWPFRRTYSRRSGCNGSPTTYTRYYTHNVMDVRINLYCTANK